MAVTMGPGFAENYYTVPADNGAAFAVPVTLMGCKRMEIVEVPAPSQAAAFAPGTTPSLQGLQYQWKLQDGSGNFDGQWKLQAQPGLAIVLGDQVAEWKGGGRAIGNKSWTDPAGNAIPASTPIKLLSQTATQTYISVKEYV
jgi:hypothetical protein